MVSALEGRWMLEDGEGNTSFALISASLEVTFVDDPDASMRIVLGSDGADGLPPDFAMVSTDGEELCRGKLVETSEGQTLELESEEGTETWRKGIEREARKDKARCTQDRFKKERRLATDIHQRRAARIQPAGGGGVESSASRPKPPASQEDLRFSEWPMDGFETLCVWCFCVKSVW
eukprot:s163_g16.t1